MTDSPESCQETARPRAAILSTARQGNSPSESGRERALGNGDHAGHPEAARVLRSELSVVTGVTRLSVRALTRRNGSCPVLSTNDGSGTATRSFHALPQSTL